MKKQLIIIFTNLIAVLSPLTMGAFSHLSPYSYCGGDPINCKDPTGCVIEGVTKKRCRNGSRRFPGNVPG